MNRELDVRIDAFWQWVQHNSGALRSGILKANGERDLEGLNDLVSVIYGQLAEVSEELVVDVHIDPDEVLLAVRTGLPEQALVDRILERAPDLPGWRFAAEILRDLKHVIARNETGREIVVPYAALGFSISDEQPGGKRDVLIVFDGDLDLDASLEVMLKDVAAHVLTTFIGRIPSSIGRYALVPRRMAKGVKVRPIFELQAAWAELVRKV
jgi:hypothetical protein